jgi:hypothetical protein
MTPEERVEIALAGGCADKVPFTIYENKIPQCAAERALRNRGLCIVNRATPGYRAHRPNVKTREEVTFRDGKRFTRIYYETPHGTLSVLNEAAGFTTWRHERMFKSPDDYKALAFWIADTVYEADYASVEAAKKKHGGDLILRGNVGQEPLQALISGGLMGMQDFCMEWMDRRDEILELVDLVVENKRRLYPIVAGAPLTHVNYGGNVVVEVIGVEAFRDYYVPHYNEAAEAMHAAGKKLGSHHDSNCRQLAGLIGESKLDYIEAFTPQPDTDMTLAEAREAWPDKALWINYPSSVWLRSDEQMEQVTVDLLKQAAPGNGLLIGVTEDVPDGRLFPGLKAINRAIHDHGRLPISAD